MGPSTKAFFLGNFAYAVQHGVSGIMAYIAWTRFGDISEKDAWFIFKLAVYLDVGFNITDLILMGISILFSIDITIYSGPRFKPVAKNRKNMKAISGIMKLLLMHHLGAVGMELSGLYLGPELDLGCRLLISLLGTTGCLHFICVCAGYTPIVNQFVLSSFILHFGTFIAMLYYRAYQWIIVVNEGLKATYHKGGYQATISVSFALLIFTLFNLDFIKHYYKVSKKSFKLIKKYYFSSSKLKSS